MDHVDAVRDLLEPPPEPAFLRQRQITEVRRRLEERPTRRIPIAQMKWAALAGAVAGFILVFALHPRRPHAPSDGVGFALVTRQGAADVEVGDDHAVAEAKMALPAGGWLTVAPSSRVVASWAGARVAVEGGPTGARVQLADSRMSLRTLTLERGRVVLDVEPLAPGAVLAVQTHDARVTVHGTRFLVEASPGGTAVAVDRGRVGSPARRMMKSRPASSWRRVRPACCRSAPTSRRASPRSTGRSPPGRPRGSTSSPTSPAPPSASTASSTAARPCRWRCRRAPTTCACAPPAACPSKSGSSSPPARPPSSTPSSPSCRAWKSPKLKSRTPRLRRRRTSVRAIFCARPRRRARRGIRSRHPRLQELTHGPATRLQLQRAALLEAQAERLARRPERALPLLQQAAHGDGPEAEQAQFLLAQTLGRDRTIRCARRRRTKPASALPHGIFSEEAALRRGEALLAAGDTGAGVAALERYLRQYPTAPHVDDAHLSIASARRDRLGDCAGAVPHLRVVADGRGPRAELALIGEARCLRTLGRAGEARDAYEKYLRMQPHGRYADEARLGATGSAKLVP